MGKRYVDDGDTIELLCTKAGDGVPALGGVPLQLKEAKALAGQRLIGSRRCDSSGRRPGI